MTTGDTRLPPDAEQDLEDHAEDVRRFLAGELPAHLLRARRVPRGIYEQRRDGLFMVRARVAGGALAVGQLRALADLSAGFGNSVLHVTTRQDLQLHDVSLADTVPVLRGLRDAGLTSRGGGGNTVRNVTACPLAGICPAERFDVTPIVRATTDHLISLKSSFNLPRKFKIAFSGCAADCAFARANDVGFVARLRDGRAGFSLYAGGGMGAWSRVADPIEDWIPAPDAVRAAEAWKRFFDRHGNRRNKHRARLRFVFEQRGAADCAAEYRGILDGLKDGDTPDAPTPAETFPSLGTSEKWSFQTLDGVRAIPQRQEGQVAVPVFLPAGLMSAADARRLADIAARRGAALRATPDQNVLLCGVPRARVADLAADLRSLSFDGVSPGAIRHFTVCAGAATCRLGLCLSRNAAEECARAMDRSGIRSETLDGIDIRVNGCSNACGQSPIGTIGLMAVAHRVGDHLSPAYRVLLGGRHGEAEFRLSETVSRIPARRLGEALSVLLANFERNRREGEPFADFHDRMGRESFKALLAPLEPFPPFATHPEFYRDLGVEEEFTLAGRGAGECGAGVFEVIQGDLAAARAAAAPFDVLLPAARALLIVRGVDAQDPDTVFREFERHFLDTGLVAGEFRGLIARARGAAQGWDGALDGQDEAVARLVDRVDLLYSTLDANLEFYPPDGVPASAPAAGVATAAELDLGGVACPMNFVKAKLRLESMNTGDALALVLDDGDPIRNVPASLRSEGQEILATERLESGRWRVVVRKTK